MIYFPIPLKDSNRKLMVTDHQPLIQIIIIRTNTPFASLRNITLPSLIKENLFMFIKRTIDSSNTVTDTTNPGPTVRDIFQEVLNYSQTSFSRMVGKVF